jgi:hypothetical protein
MRTENSGGDVLARGGARAQFRTANSSVTQEKWDSIFGGKDEPEDSNSRAYVETPRNVGSVSREVKPDATGL